MKALVTWTDGKTSVIDGVQTISPPGQAIDAYVVFYEGTHGISYLTRESVRRVDTYYNNQEDRCSEASPSSSTI